MRNDTIPETSIADYISTRGWRHYELSNHLGNVQATVADYIQGDDDDNPEVEVYSSQDYYAFGMVMPGRSYTFTGNSSLNRYRFAWNGAEAIDEIYGKDGGYDLGARMYNPRLGRMFSTDPREMEYAWQSTYAYYANSPISEIDFNGEGENDGPIPLIPKFNKETGNALNDYPAAINNGLINLANVVPETANSAYSTVKALSNGTYLQGLGNEVKGMYEGAKAKINELISMPTTDLLKKAVSPGAVEVYSEFVLGALTGKVSVNGKANPIKPSGPVPVPNPGGRHGSPATRSQIENIANTLENRGYTITGGGGRVAEEYLKPIGGGRKGGSYPDITAIHPKYPTLRINTVDVLKDGITPTAREQINAARIRSQIASGEHLLMIPKK